MMVIPVGVQRRSGIQEMNDTNGMDQRGFWIPGLARSARSPGMTKKEGGSPGMTKKEARPE